VWHRRPFLFPEGASMSDTADRVDDAADRIEVALERVETAIKDKWSTFQWIAVIYIGIFVFSLPGNIWHSKSRYTATYDIPASEIYVQDKPHDCAFLAAPLGEKYCHYERTVSVTRWATSQTGNPIISYDDGKTWTVFDPAGKEVPKFSTVKNIYISWEKKEN
jgi:hypothetical protein